MKFGKVDKPEEVDFTIPHDHPDTKVIFNKFKKNTKPTIYIGCAKWNKTDLKGFYPRGTKDELSYYSTQFNSIELNATFYGRFTDKQVTTWREKTPEGFKFFPKITQSISHYKQLNNFEEALDQYLGSITNLENKLGTIFLQLNDRFGPNRMEKVQKFVESWPKDLRLAVEVRHQDWFSDKKIMDDFCALLTENNVANILVDTAGRRDMMHMRMTTPEPFVRWVGANHPGDYNRIDEWVERIGQWIDQGMTELHFFVHQNLEKESPLLSAHMIKQLNVKYGYNMHIPGEETNSEDLFSKG